MIEPFLKDEAFLEDVALASGDREKIHLWWLGQSGFLMMWQGSALLLDPYLSDSLTRKYAGTNKPHVRMTGRVIAPEKLDFIHVVTSSHNHTDHLDGETLIPLLNANPGMTILVPEANRDFAANRLQVPPDRLTGIFCGTPLQIGAFTFHAIPSAHEQLEVDANGHHRFIGLVVEAGQRKIYHSGDTIRFEGMETWLRPWHVDIGLLPINGRDEKRGVPGNLSGPEAVRLAQDSGIQLIIPCHYDMFEFNTASPEAFIQSAQQSGQAYQVLRCGQHFSLPN